VAYVAKQFYKPKQTAKNYNLTNFILNRKNNPNSTLFLPLVSFIG
jgi:hypothetical protein